MTLNFKLSSSPAKKWDAIIVGSGMGGGTMAYALANKGFEVLLLEKGYDDFSKADQTDVIHEQVDPTERMVNGKWPFQVSGTTDGNNFDIWAPLGCGLGGTSQLYAAALQRYEPMDFELRTASNGRQVGWPCSYQEIEPYYLQAEAIYSVCGTQNPLDEQIECQLNSPPAMCESDNYFYQFFKDKGLHPYRLHVGLKYMPGCGECGGRICQTSCKQTSLNSCILPALDSGNLTIAAHCEVLSLDADDKKIRHIEVRQFEQTFQLEAEVLILAAGAYFTPVILQNSKNTYWPNGVANNNDLVGRNLMFHANDFISLWSKKGLQRENGARKSLALRDFYQVGDKKIGELQSTGMYADYGNVLYSLRRTFEQTIFGKIKFLHHFLRIPAYIGSKIFGDATLFSAIVEDYPYLNNRVVADNDSPSGLRFEYTVSAELKERVHIFRRQLREVFKPGLVLPMNYNVMLNYGHPCGTCLAGLDPESSVVDKYCKVHELDNLYIVDASAMPTSGGTNPSLTIAANALRVADAIGEKYQATIS